MKLRAVFVCLFVALFAASAAPVETAISPFMQKHCVECHDADTKKGDLDLTALKFDVANPTNFSKWVLIFDRVSNGEMPPKKKARPETVELETFTSAINSALTSAEQAHIASEGRATQRRLNR